MQEAGLPVQKQWRCNAMNNSVEAGYAKARTFVSARGVTAVVCSSDHVAVGLAQAAYDAGICVPEELSIVGFDGVGQERMSKPILSTVRQPVIDIGKRLAHLLVQRINDGDDGTKVNEQIQPKLVLNDSTAAPQSVLTAVSL
jgi:DNA-binding LacI/PurR family transcriptional regulator